MNPVAERVRSQTMELAARWETARANLLALEASDQVRDSMVRLHHGFDHAVGASLHRYEQAREQQRERFIAVLGHDLRQPLGAINGRRMFEPAIVVSRRGEPGRGRSGWRRR